MCIFNELTAMASGEFAPEEPPVEVDGHFGTNIAYNSLNLLILPFHLGYEMIRKG